MSHIHIPDGVLPLWLVIAGWAVAAALIGLAVRRVGGQDLRRRVPLVGAVAALMLVGMSTEIVPIAYHVNLTVIAGILLGPWLSIITAFVVDLMLSLVGHGGITVVGLNTLVIAAEMIFGWALFRAFVGAFGRRRAAPAAAAATVIALALSTTLLVGIVAVGGTAATTRETGAFDPATLSFSNPFSDGIAANHLLGGEEHEYEESSTAEEEEGHDHESEDGELSVSRFAAMVYTLGAIGWIIEALITALVIGFVSRVRPGLVFEGTPAEGTHAPVGDEGTHH